jgi:hypothetical protein
VQILKLDLSLDQKHRFITITFDGGVKPTTVFSNDAYWIIDDYLIAFDGIWRKNMDIRVLKIIVFSEIYCLGQGDRFDLVRVVVEKALTLSGTLALIVCNINFRVRRLRQNRRLFFITKSEEQQDNKEDQYPKFACFHRLGLYLECPSLELYAKIQLWSKLLHRILGSTFFSSLPLS